jgi:DNA-binding GntR family transcriptional regulator
MRALAVAETLRQDIRAGRYHPRERLVEADLAEVYGVKRSAVRAALLELAAEGVVERTPNRGARVRAVSIDEAIEITETRLSLQALVAGKAALEGTDEQRAELARLLDVLREAVAADDRERTVTTNAAIFALIREMGARPTANAIIERLYAQNSGNLFPFAIPERRVASLHEFERIVAAVLARDEEGAYAAMTDHREHVLAALRAIRDGRPVEGAID